MDNTQNLQQKIAELEKENENLKREYDILDGVLGLYELKYGNKETVNFKEVITLDMANDKELLNMLIAEKTADSNLPPQAYCPVCKCDILQVDEIAENDAERGIYKYKCQDCGCVFYITEDKIAACRRGIENAENKIKYFNKILGGA
jgi:hypothetical protein